MQIILNGEVRIVSERITARQLLQELKGQISNRSKWVDLDLWTKPAQSEPG